MNNQSPVCICTCFCGLKKRKIEVDEDIVEEQHQKYQDTVR